MNKQNNSKVEEQKQNQQEVLPTAPGVCKNKLKYEIIIRDVLHSVETSYLLKGKEQASVGAEPSCSIPVDDDYISSTHFHIDIGSKGIEVTDNNSRNGLFVKIEKPTIIQPGQTLLAGRTTFTVQERIDA